ncbi:NADH-quinone oxidoreductase subunit A [Amnibacterium endophyticum]|uniref:NADH-quinone oxidoreductase subunit n=1 Tax=Amnibacterium endophyticum TaxID=2109337 RepID=A0ABW4LG24_9MICO
MGVYLPVGIALGVVLLGVATVYGTARLVAAAPTAAQVMAFQSGFMPQEHALSRFHARWYPLTLLFLAFDVEMLFMYPWAVVAGQIGAESIIEMFVFLGVLMAGVVWAWREGTLRWV